MIDKQLQLSVDLTLNKAQSIFVKKARDYGTSWRDMRVISLADQLYIKAKRIGEISKVKQKVTGEGNDIESEFLGIINYSIVGVIQNRLNDPIPGEPKMSADEAISNYISVVEKFYNYSASQHIYLIDKILGYSTIKFSEKLQQKCKRIESLYRIKDRDNKVVIFGAFMEILFWSLIGHCAYETTQK